MLNKITDNVEIHQTLPDTPNMTTQELKKEWDKGNKIIKEAFNKLIDKLNEAKIISTVLYKNEGGLAENVILNTTANDCRCVDIVYSFYGTFFSKRVYKKEFSNFVLDGMTFTDNATSYNFSSNYSIDNTNLNLTKSKSGNFSRSYTSGEIVGSTSTSNVKIHEVIGYK